MEVSQCDRCLLGKLTTGYSSYVQRNACQPNHHRWHSLWEGTHVKIYLPCTVRTYRFFFTRAQKKRNKFLDQTIYSGKYSDWYSHLHSSFCFVRSSICFSLRLAAWPHFTCPPPCIFHIFIYLSHTEIIRQQWSRALAMPTWISSISICNAQCLSLFSVHAWANIENS